MSSGVPVLENETGNGDIFENVLVPVDFSENSRSVLHLIREIPGIRKIVLLHVIYNRYPSEDPSVVRPATRKAGEILEEMAGHTGLPDAAVKTIIREISGGEISDTINRVAREEDTSLIMMSRRGEGIIGTLLLGSVASDLVRYGENNLFLIPPAGRAGTESTGRKGEIFSRVMICTDFSEPEIGIICPDLLPRMGSVSLFHAVTSAKSQEEIRGMEKTAAARLGEIKDFFTSRGIGASVRVVTGSAPEEILAFSEREDISLIILKSRGKKSLISSFIGSTSAPVARNARKPVLILKQYPGRAGDFGRDR